MASALAIDDPAELTEVLNEIEDCRDYESSWDPDDPRVSEDAIRASRDLILRAFAACRKSKVCWESPMVAVTPDARIHLSWGQRGRWVSWRVGAADEPVVLVLTTPESEPTRQEVSTNEAIEALVEFQHGCDCA